MVDPGPDEINKRRAARACRHCVRRSGPRRSPGPLHRRLRHSRLRHDQPRRRMERRSSLDARHRYGMQRLHRAAPQRAVAPPDGIMGCLGRGILARRGVHGLVPIAAAGILNRPRVGGARRADPRGHHAADKQQQGQHPGLGGSDHGHLNRGWPQSIRSGARAAPESRERAVVSRTKCWLAARTGDSTVHPITRRRILT